MCINDLFYKSLDCLLKHYGENCLNRKLSEIVKNTKKVEEAELVKLFEGLHPLVFHRFEARGIFVVQFYIRSKWLYIIVDDKIPCNE